MNSFWKISSNFIMKSEDVFQALEKIKNKSQLSK